MKELYNRPVCIIAINQNGIGKGSGRSIHGIPLGEIILEALSLNIINSLNKVFDNYENVNFNFLGTLNVDTWNNTKSIELMLDDIIYADVT